MRLNKKMLAVTAILAVGILAGCGSAASSGSTAGSAASSAPASSAASSAPAETDAAEPIDTEDGDVIEELQNGDSSYKVHAAITNVSDDSVTLDVYGYDAYEQADIKGLQTGGILRTHDQETGKLADVTVDSIETDAESGYVTINGGIEEGGVELCLDHDVYRTVTMDDYPVYYKIGEVTLPLADDVTLEDSSADPQASAMESSGKADVARDLADSDNWNVTNTTVFVEKGQVFDVQRVWVP